MRNVLGIEGVGGPRQQTHGMTRWFWRADGVRGERFDFAHVQNYDYRTMRDIPIQLVSYLISNDTIFTTIR